MKRVLLTGAASGIGRAVFDLLDAGGAQIIALDSKPLAVKLQRYIACNLADPLAIDRAVSQIDGHLDAVVNVAGVPGTLDPLLVMQVNFFGLRHLTECLVEGLEPGASIVNIASIAGANWQRHMDAVSAVLATDGFDSGSQWCKANPRVGSRAYTLSKECVVAYTKRLAERALRSGFNCNSVSPGPVETPILPDFMAQEHPGQIDWVIAQTKRAAKPVDIARVVRFLMSPDAAWINGQDIQVDGGFSAGLEAGWIDGSRSPRNADRS